MSDYTCVLPFLTDDPQFAAGVEVGMLHERMKRRRRIRGYYQTVNQEQITLMANRYGWRVVRMEVWADGPEWFFIDLRRREAV